MRPTLPLLLLLTAACAAPRSGTGSGSGGPSDDAHEPNDSSDAAARVACGDIVTGTALDPDWFVVETVAEGPATASLTWTDGAADLTLRMRVGDAEIDCPPSSGLRADCSTQAPAGEVRIGIVPGDDAGATYGLEIDCLGAPTGDDDDAAPPDATLIGTGPEEGATDFFFRSSPWVRWDFAPEGASLELLAGGTSVAGSTSWSESDRRATFTPAGDLAPSTSHTLRIRWADEEADLSFRTGPHGLPVAQPGDLAGATFHLDLSDAEWLDPAVLGALLQGYLADVYLLLGVRPESEFTPGAQPGLHMTVTSGELDGPPTLVQGECAVVGPSTVGHDLELGTADDEPGSFENPAISFTPIDIDPRPGIEGLLDLMDIAGVVHPDGTDIAGLSIRGEMRASTLGSIIGEALDEDEACDLLVKTGGVECVPCGEGDGRCIDLHLEGARAHRLPDLTLVDRTCAELIDDPECGIDDWDPNEDGVPELCPDYQAR